MTLGFTLGVAEVRPGELDTSSDATTWRYVLQNFEAAVEDPSAMAMISLRSAVMDFAAVARRENLPPERAVVAFKTLLVGHRREGWAPSLATDGTKANAESAVYAKMFSWFVSALFAT
jgi:hypothetical protein